MKKSRKSNPVPSAIADYGNLLTDIKQRIRSAQVRTAMSSNVNMLVLYWEIGGVLAVRQQEEGWGAAVLPRLAVDLLNELPELKGFSDRNMRRMIQFHQEYPELFSIWPLPVAKSSEANLDTSIRSLPVAKLENRAALTSKGPRPVAQLPAETIDAAIWQRAVAKSARNQRTNVGPACRAGLSSNARTALERTFNQRRRVACGFTSLNRRSRHVAKSSSARRTYRTQSLPAAKTNTLRTLSP